MWPFRRQPQELTSAIWDGQWSIGEIERDGRRTIVRKNQGAASLVGDARFPVRVGVAVPFHRPDAGGMPAPDEFPRLSAIEDDLIDHFQADRRAVAVLSITTGGMREFVFYAADAKWAEGILHDARSRVPDYELQSYVVPDPKWDVYRQFRLE
jgi:hypothetical protein